MSTSRLQEQQRMAFGTSFENIISLIPSRLSSSLSYAQQRREHHNDGERPETTHCNKQKHETPKTPGAATESMSNSNSNSNNSSSSSSQSEQAFVSALYNTIAIALFVVCVGLLVMLLIVLQAFVRSIMWALLTSAFLFAFKRYLAEQTLRGLASVEQAGSPLALTLLLLPLRAADAAVDRLWSLMRTKYRHLGAIVAAIVTFHLASAFYQTLFDALLKSSAALSRVTNALAQYAHTAWPLGGALCAAYALALCLYWRPERTALFQLLSLPCWMSVASLCSTLLGTYRPLVTLASLGLVLIGVYSAVYEFVAKQQRLRVSTIAESTTAAVKTSATTPRSSSSSTSAARALRVSYKKYVIKDSSATLDATRPFGVSSVACATAAKEASRLLDDALIEKDINKHENNNNNTDDHGHDHGHEHDDEHDDEHDNEDPNDASSLLGANETTIHKLEKSHSVSFAGLSDLEDSATSAAVSGEEQKPNEAAAAAAAASATDDSAHTIHDASSANSSAASTSSLLPQVLVKSALHLYHTSVCYFNPLPTVISPRGNRSRRAFRCDSAATEMNASDVGAAECVDAEEEHPELEQDGLLTGERDSGGNSSGDNNGDGSGQANGRRRANSDKYFALLFWLFVCVKLRYDLYVAVPLVVAVWQLAKWSGGRALQLVLSNGAVRWYARAVRLWLARRKAVLLPAPFQLLVRLFVRGDRKVNQLLQRSIDSLTSVLVIVLLLAGVASGLVLLATQVHSESLQLIGMCSEVLNENVYAQPELRAWLPEKAKLTHLYQMGVSKLYQHGREWLSKALRSSLGPASSNGAGNGGGGVGGVGDIGSVVSSGSQMSAVDYSLLEAQLLDQWDRLYAYLTQQTSTPLSHTPNEKRRASASTTTPPPPPLAVPPKNLSEKAGSAQDSSGSGSKRDTSIGTQTNDAEAESPAAFRWQFLRRLLLNTESATAAAFDYRNLVLIVKDNLGILVSVLDSLYQIVRGNVNLLATVLYTLVSVVFSSGFALMNFVFSFVVYATALFYLLAMSGARYKPFEWLTSITLNTGDHSSDPRVDNGNNSNNNSNNNSRSQLLIRAVEDSIRSVFVVSLKMATFFGLYTYVVNCMFSVSIVYLPAIVAALLAFLPLLGTYWTCLPGILELWLVQDKPVQAAIYTGLHALPYVLAVDQAIYGEIKVGHPYLSSLAFAGGVYCLGLEGAFVGPIILCLFIVIGQVITNPAKMNSALNNTTLTAAAASNASAANCTSSGNARAVSVSPPPPTPPLLAPCAAATTAVPPNTEADEADTNDKKDDKVLNV